MKWLKLLVFVLSAAFIGIQFVRPSRGNPPVDESLTLFAKMQVPDDVHAILDRSCADCHSNKTHWPWYSHVAPVSWLVAEDVKDGRGELNFSEWGTYTEKKAKHKLEEICEMVEKQEMPLKKYTFLHPSAKLSDADRARLCEWTEMERGTRK